MFLYGIKKTLTTNFQSIETHQLHRVYFKGVMCHVSRIFAVTKINKKNNFANIKIVRERREKVWEQLNVS